MISRHNQIGAGLVEYGLLISLIIATCYAGLTTLGEKLPEGPCDAAAGIAQRTTSDQARWNSDKQQCEVLRVGNMGFGGGWRGF